MHQKSTKELLNELKKNERLSDYLANNQDAFSTSDLKAYLDGLLQEKNFTKAQAIARSGLHEIYAYQIFAGKKAPSRDKVLALCFGMRLSIAEAQRLLNKSGVAELYPRNRRDSILMFALKKELSAIECNLLLTELSEPELK